jgi:Ca2+-transporting ATPase
VVALATAASAPLPILPLQILFLNLVTDVFPALALGVGPGDPDVMRHRPRPAAESILTRDHWVAVSAYGLLITAAVLGAFGAALLWLEAGDETAVTVSFLTLALAQLWHVFNMRDSHAPLLGSDVVRNPWVWCALLLCLALVGAGVFVPALAGLLGVVPLEPRAWLLVAGCSLLPLLVGQLALAVLRHRRLGDGSRPA